MAQPTAKRFLRFVVRPMAWGTALLLLAIVALVLFLRSELLQERARALLVARLQDFAGRPVEIGRVRLGFFPLSLEAWDMTLAGRLPEDPPALTIPHAYVELDWYGWRRPVIQIRTIQVDRPRMLYTFDADGRDNWPRFKFARRPAGTVVNPAPRRFTVRVEHLQISGGEFQLDDVRWPVEVDARGAEGTLLGVDDLKLRGKARVEDIVVTLPRAHPVHARLSGEVEIERGVARFREVQLDAPSIAARGAGEVRWGASRSLDLDLSILGSTDALVTLGYVDDQIAGPLDLDGKFHWEPQAWNYSGQARSERFTVIGRTFEGLSGPFRGDRDGVRWDIERATHHGGAVDGFFAVDLRTRDYRSEVSLAFRDVDASGMFLDQSIPVEPVSATVDGSFGYRFTFKDGARGDGEVKARLRAGAAAPGRLPIAGELAVLLANGVVSVPPARLSAEETAVTVEGSYDIPAESGHFRIGVDTGRLTDLVPFLPVGAPDEPVALWVPTAGKGRLDADLELGVDGPRATVELALQEPVTAGLSGSSARGRFRIDARWVDELDLTVERPGATARIVGRIPLRELPQSPLPGAMAITVDARGWPLDDARLWLPEDLVELPVNGRFEGHVALAGDPEAPSGRAEGRLAGARWSEAPLGALEFEVGFRPEGVDVESARLVMGGGTVNAMGTIDLTVTPARLDLRLEGALRLDREPFAREDAASLHGRAELSGRVLGTTEVPVATATLGLSGLAVDDRRLGESGTGRLSARWENLVVDLEGEIPGLASVAGGGPLAWKGVEGDERLEADWRVDVAVPDLVAAANVLSATPIEGLAGRLAGSLTAQGPLDALRWAAEIGDLEARYREHSVVALEPIRASLDGEALRILSLYLGEPGSTNEFFLAGSVGLVDAGSLDLRLQATMAAAWLAPLLPPGDVSGTIDALAAIRGTLSQPAVSGQATLEQGRLLFADFPQVLEDVEATVLADPGRWILDHASLRLGGGTLQASGSLQTPTGEGEEISYRLQVRAREVTLRYPEGFWMRGGGELSLVSATPGRQIRGFLELSQLAYVRDIDVSLAQLLRGFLGKQRVEVADADEFLSTTQLNVSVQAPGTFRVSNNLARLRGSADLTVRGTLATPVLFGRIEIEPGGTLVYGENDYTIEQARVTFVNPYAIEPLIDLKARTRINPYEVTLSLFGPPERLEARFSSDPPIPDIDILTLLASGGSGDPGAQAGAYSAGTFGAGGANGLPGQNATFGAESFLAGQAANFVGERVNQLFRFDRFRVAPLQGSGENISSVRVTVGKRLSRDVYVTYSVDPSASRDQILSVEWRVASSLSLVFTQNGAGSYAVDARWETIF
jgi:hypothetical protein